MGDENGNVLRYRLERVEDKTKGLEEGTKLLAEFGQRHNEQINTLRGDVHELKEAVKDVPVIKAELADLKESWRATRNVGYAVFVALISSGAAVVWQGLQ